MAGVAAQAVPVQPAIGAPSASQPDSAIRDPIQDLMSLDTGPAAPKVIEMPSGLPPQVLPATAAGKSQPPLRTSFGGEKDPFYDSSDDEGAANGAGFSGFEGLAPAPSAGQRFKVGYLVCMSLALVLDRAASSSPPVAPRYHS